MRIRIPAVSSRAASKLIGAVCLASLAAGCSSEVTRFQDGLFTGTVPEPLGRGAPSRPASQQQPDTSALNQPYPGDMSANSSAYDTTHTGSVPRSGPALARPSQPSSQQAPVYVQQAAVERKPLRQAPPVQPRVRDIALSPVPVVTERTVDVPVKNIPTPYPAPTQTAALGASASVPVDPIITGGTPSSTAARKAEAASSNVVGGWSTTGGTRVKIAPGETIYNLSRRYGVPAREIMKANNIADPSKVAAGEVVVIPTYVYSRTAPISAPDNNPKTRAARATTGYQGEARPDKVPVPVPAPVRQAAVLPTAPSVREPVRQNDASQTAVSQGTAAEKKPKPAGSNAAAAKGTYTVKAGDSLSAIASRTGMSVSALKTANGLSDSKIRIGQVLRVPQSATGVDSVQTASVASKPEKRPASAASVSTYAVETKKADKVSTVAAVKADAPKATGIDKLRWPARGQVVGAYGAVDNGNRNDGIDISLPKGTPVKAAENGVVIYAGTGLKEYGKTVLVRHANGLVSVYGHASELIVERGDSVSRGQVVALSGMSGQAKAPKLHFEIRKDAKPVDPMTYLE
ncbi:peptidoglycan DD-metalloendopeptidase family protein [Hoeflea prorocentri]|uniref:Peptidoglycan DD-metalloendopeptidase family protein n=2 Tax=Hoeflea prorocentri TaxID=1922333 RepID=A0A9X3UGU2_9HYPH|nr:peptidoglycan DD-metalloendopeptidase family protein [Hoeflea prorocentri]MDA5398390.1 peptidoglycan DD-metalloendopeptidase family protein [Hoeflea prorocentri]